MKPSMITRADIIKEVGEEWYWLAAKEARKGAPKCGRIDAPTGLDFDDYASDTAYDIRYMLEPDDCSKPYDDTMPSPLPAILEIYNDIPSYSILSLCYSDYKWNRYSKADVALMWKSLREFVGSEDETLAGPALYVLWVDFFEDGETCEEACRQMFAEPRSDLLLKRLLGSSGPVPCDLKFSIYDQLLPDMNWHPLIFQSLYGSEFDVYGQLNTAVERQRAREILRKLQIPTYMKEEFATLSRSLSEEVRFPQCKHEDEKRSKSK